jgi:dihydroorotase
MNILIRQAKIIQRDSEFHNKKADILIEAGQISKIGRSIPAKSNYKIIEAEGLCVSAGWIDLQAVSCDPGFEHKEDLDSLVDCAAAGGFTAVCVHNYNQPALHTKAQIEYIMSRTRNSVTEVIPFGTITVDGKSKDLAEMYDMKLAGARAFSDHKHAVSEGGTVLRALQYAENIGSLIITHCNDESIAGKGLVHEGEVAVGLGLRGIPSLAEELMLRRNVSILEYAGGRLHIPTVSSEGSIDIIRNAKADGLKITCGVAVANLLLDESNLTDFDTNYKLDPPLRTVNDALALRRAVKSGLIDVIVSDHLPQDVESKELEFDLADNGMISLQTAFGCALEALGKENLPAIVKCFTENPRKILGLPNVKIKAGQEANLTLFTAEGKSALSEKNNRSRSRNSPFMDKPLPGKVIGIVRGEKSHFNT